MKEVLIISLKFHPGHVSHMIASYKQCEELGFRPSYYVDTHFELYLPKESNIIIHKRCKKPKANIAIFLFPSQKNLPLIWHLKRHGTKIIYIFHEPLAPMKIYRNAGFSIRYLIKLWIIDHVSAYTVKYSDTIIIPSKKAINYYETNKRYTNKNYYYFPLMYSDERKEKHILQKRRYFSYIGTIAADHSFKEYIEFVKWTIVNNKLEGINFLIATKNEFDVPEILQKSERVKIHKGLPMSDEQINSFYSSTIVIWNAYTRTTQSGVLAKSFMFGTPALVLRKNLNEFTKDGINVISICDNTNKEEIAEAIQIIINNLNSFSTECRKEFERSFYYRVYNLQIKEIIIQ